MVVLMLLGTLICNLIYIITNGITLSTQTTRDDISNWIITAHLARTIGIDSSMFILIFMFWGYAL